MPGKRQDVFYQAQAVLSRRDHSAAEVKAKLARKGFTTDEIAKTVDFLQEKKLLDDARFAQAYVESILRAKPVGPRYLSAKLKQKEIGESIIQKTLLQVFSPPYEGGVPAEGGGRGREAILAEQAAAQWKRIHPKHAQDKQRLFRFLSSRGFTHDAISAILES